MAYSEQLCMPHVGLGILFGCFVARLLLLGHALCRSTASSTALLRLLLLLLHHMHVAFSSPFKSPALCSGLGNQESGLHSLDIVEHVRISLSCFAACMQDDSMSCQLAKPAALMVLRATHPPPFSVDFIFSFGVLECRQIKILSRRADLLLLQHFGSCRPCKLWSPTTWMAPLPAT
jgi:hypothetical protein